MVNHAFPVIGQIEIENIQPEHIRDLLLPIWGRSPSTSSKVLADVRAILRWTIALRLRENRENPADLNGALGVLMEPYSKNRKTQDNHSSLDFHEIPAFVKDIKALRSRTSEMLLFSILLAARSKAVRNAKWEDIDIENKIWHIPPEDDKVKDEKRSRHIYLNDAAVSLLKEVIRFPESPYVFCSPHGGTYTDMAMNQVIRKAHARKKIVDGFGWIDKEKTKRMGKECIAICPPVPYNRQENSGGSDRDEVQRSAQQNLRSRCFYFRFSLLTGIFTGHFFWPLSTLPSAINIT